MTEEQEKWAKMERDAFRVTEEQEKWAQVAERARLARSAMKPPRVTVETEVFGWKAVGLIALAIGANLGLFYLLLLMVKKVFFN